MRLAPALPELPSEQERTLVAALGAHAFDLRVGDESYHCVELGRGPTVVLLHGMPAFWYSYRHQLPALANAGYRAIAVDLSGYNLSSKPHGIAAYDDAVVLARMTQLLAQLSPQPVHLVGHDRGGWLAWMLAMHRPERVRSLTVLAVPHPRRLRENLYRWDQLRRSWYAYFLQLPWLPEQLFRLADHALLKRVIAANRLQMPLTPRELDAYVEAAARPFALTSMFNYYRANARAVLRKDPLWWAAQLPSVRAPTLVLWPTGDRYQAPLLAAPDPTDVPDLRLVRLGGGHWLHEDNPSAVNAELLRFLKAASRPEAATTSPIGTAARLASSSGDPHTG